jgi:SAM-dependent methyltransferase
VILSRIRHWGMRLTDRTITTPAPRLSIIVVVFNMRREAPRTLFSLSPAYQRHVNAGDYEVIVVENGSDEPLEAADMARFGPNFRYLWIDDASPSPAGAINRGVALTRAPFVGIMIDGARIATPGVVALALQGLQRFERAVVGTVGFHLGPDTQMYSLRHGYNQAVEDDLLARIDWRNHGYRLFEIGSQAGSSPLNWLGTINESNLIFLSRALFEELSGYDERFALPGGGIVNLDFYCRACELPNSTLLTLFGEATFHQVHGGAITNQPASELPRRLQTYGEEYLRIRGVPFERPTREPLLFGHAQPEIMPWLRKACEFAAQSLAPSATVDGVLVAECTVEAAVIPFDRLTWLGLREHHHLLELGSGSLPASRSCIPYLQPGHYFAVKFTDRPVWEEIAATLGAELTTLKQPRFARADDFSLDVFDVDTGFDFILASALFGHGGLTQIRRCLISVRRILKPSGLLVAAFGERAADEARDAWVYPAKNFYRWATLAGLCAEVGLHCRKLDWPHPEWTWFVVAIDPRRLDARATPGIFPVASDLASAGH